MRDRQGRERKRWEDIREWTGLKFGKSQRAVENRGKWSCGAPTTLTVKGLMRRRRRNCTNGQSISANKT